MPPPNLDCNAQDQAPAERDHVVVAIMVVVEQSTERPRLNIDRQHGLIAGHCLIKRICGPLEDNIDKAIGLLINVLQAPKRMQSPSLSYLESALVG